MRSNSFAAALLCLVAIGLRSDAAPVFSNAISGTNPNTSNPYISGQTVDANLSVSGIGRGPNIASANANNRYNASGWTTLTSVDLNDYFYWTLTPTAGYSLSLDDLVYTGQSSGDGPTIFALRSSADGYTSNIATPAAGGATISLSAASFQNLTAAITFRLYGYDAVTGGGTYSVNDFTFNGTVAAVPEASSFLFGGFVCAVVGLTYFGRKSLSMSKNSMNSFVSSGDDIL